ncbi:hypothetical protein F2Q70_00002831 [Brassica cretica]|uniref:Retrotransposon gag domain-containing protein n=1 Tax=Brassica cretica TaxID=69181 RepID=A0A8S9J4I1_BRACR|nr:hypothetical protein F2Q70_00002831 [Brassica cretica]
MCEGSGSTLTGPALQWYINLPSRSIASFAPRAEPLRGYIARFNQEKVAIPECSIPTAISAFKRGLLPDGDLYKELTKYQCKTMEDVLSRAWAQVKWEEDVASRAKAQQKPDPKTIRPDRTKLDEKPSQRSAWDSGNRNRGRFQNRPIEKAEGMAVSTLPDISHLSVSRPELVNVLSQMGQQVKWPQKMKAPDSFRNPGFWCDFHRDHDHKTEDCITLKIEVNELLRKGHLREFLSDKAKSHLSKETTEKHLERQARLEAAKPKWLLLGKDKISFTAKEHEKVLTPHHDALVISLTVVNCLVKRILVDNGSSGNIIFEAAYKDVRLEEGALKNPWITRSFSRLCASIQGTHGLRDHSPDSKKPCSKKNPKPPGNIARPSRCNHNLKVPRLPPDRSIIFRTKTTPMQWLGLKQASKSLD